ncbi:Gfo/Idh/MocA family protein [Dermabacteraceae bacterium P13147]
MSTVRVGMIGAGYISAEHARAWRELGVELTIHAVAGAKELAHDHGAEVADTLDELLDRSDLVDVITPTATHAELVTTALEAGKDVVCEKPLTADLASAHALRDTALRTGRQLFPGQVVRYDPAYHAVHKAIGLRRLGDLAVLRYERSGLAPKSAWYADESTSGGIVMDLMIHDIDQALWNAGPVTSVHATRRGLGSDEHSQIQAAHVVLTHESGTVSHVRGLWGAEGTTIRSGFSLYGTGGVIEHDSRDHSGVRLDFAALENTRRSGGYVPSDRLTESPFLTQLRDVHLAVTQGREVRTSLDEGIYSVEVCLAAIESLRSGNAVRLADMLTEEEA